MALPGGQEPDNEALREEAADWFSRMRGANAESARPEFERWRTSDPRNQDAYSRIARDFEVSGLLRSSEFYRAHTAPRGVRALSARPGLIAAGAVFVLLLAVTGMMLVPGLYLPAGTASAAMPIETTIGQIKRTILSDGSVVTLDTDSKVEVAVTGGAPSVKLVRGRARREASAPDRVATIAAAGLVVTGVRFDVSVGDRATRVTSISGGVDVSDKASSNGAATHLANGQALIAETETRAPVIALASKGEAQWVNGMLSFDSVPLGDVLAQTNRYSAAKLRLENSALGALKVTGAFRPLPVGDLAAALAAAFALRVEHAPNGDLILHRR